MNPHFNCQEYEEVETLESALSLHETAPLDRFFQLKYDGIWGQAIIASGAARIFSKTGMQKETIHIEPSIFHDNRETVLLGEYMYGSQWSKQPHLAGKFFAFDIVILDGEDISHLTYAQRFRRLQMRISELGPRFAPIPTYHWSRLPEMWLHLESLHTHEGIIIRKWSSTYYTKLHKLKVSVEDDFVITGFIEGEGKHAGRLGALELSQFDSGVLVHVMDVGGGFSDELRTDIWQRKNDFYLAVCLIAAKGRFESGALRHPNFVRIRDDKPASQCLLKKRSQ